jgi:hypothetical protein
VLTIAELQGLLERFTYKPGWTFTMWHDEFEGNRMEIFINSEVNAYKPDELTVMSIKTYVPPIESPAAFWRYLLWRLERVEMHELREFFRVGGHPIFDPHSEVDYRPRGW